jgi:tRNA threonylcarbamoyladenosine biosynthesis protein TsaB
LALILNIDTATELASVCLTENENPLGYRENGHQKEHASFVHLAIQQVMAEVGKTLGEVDAIAVTSGPGSYTGLRVGLATAKGLCFALNKPLVTIATLEVMFQAALTQLGQVDGRFLYCPMIDARRMEVFTAIFSAKKELILEPQALVITEETFQKYLNENGVVFFGSGSDKLQKIMSNENALFRNVISSSKDLGTLASRAFNAKTFADVAYSSPNYLKEFHSTEPKIKKL